ncbi:MAG: acylphosphatase [Dehalococcoidia bacterium]|jgi:acylphosphatase|nr:acylphosphatase [Chloroflexota bacterium]MCK4242895.1 acylphosphatase [Dehalococcoidia bacterium]
MSQEACLHALVYGVVQGVNFRSFVLRHARDLGLTGYVRNLYPEEVVEVKAEGWREQLEQLLRLLEEGPRGAWVERVDANWSEYSGDYNRFELRF